VTGSFSGPVYLHRDRFDPAPDLVRLSKQSPVSKIDLPAPGPWNAASAWLVTGYREVRSVLRDSRSFSSSPRLEVMQAAVAPNIFSSAGNLLLLEAPEHARLRRLLNREFATRSLQGLIPAIQKIVREHLDGMEDMGAPVDLVESFSYPVSILVLCEFVGIPHEERMEFVRRNYSRAREIYISMEEQIGVYLDSREYVKGIVARQRADPGDNLLGRLIRRHGRNSLTRN
jgi:cytochrome P450